MLTANVMLFATTRRLFGYWPAVTASGLFAGLALTQNLGIYATYDVMSLMFMTVAAYCAIRSGETPWLLALPLLVVVANATKYATIVFDPVIIAMAALQGESYAWRSVARRLVALSATIGTAVLITAALAGTAYVRGAMWTTFARNSRLQSLEGGGPLQQPEAIVDKSLHWIGAVFVVSLLALLFALARKNWDQIAYLIVLIVAGSLVTLESVRLHSSESMWKHDDFAVWFSCAAAGAVVNYVEEACHRRWKIANTAVAVTCAGLIPLTLGLYSTPQARNGNSYATRPLEIAAAAFLKPYLEHGRFLMGARQDDPTLYYDHLAIPWWNHFDDLYIKYPIPGRGGNTHDEGDGLVCYSLKPRCTYLEGPVGYRMAIRAHWFSLVTLVGRAGQTVRDKVIIQTVEHTHGYTLISRIGGEPTWIYLSDYRNYPRLSRDHALSAT